MLFGNIIDGKMVMNEMGKIVKSIWQLLPDRFSVVIDTYQIMPNHVHGIIIIDDFVGAGLVPALTQEGHPQGMPLHKNTLGEVIGAFKSLTTNAWAQGKFWQRNYYEHIIRNEKDLEQISQYILDNPSRWEEDSENPVTQVIPPGTKVR